MIDRVLSWLQRRSQPTEDSTEYDGFLSYAGEFHAVVAGFGAGMAAAMLDRPELLGVVYAVALGVRGVEEGKRPFKGRGVVHELQREPWYAIGAATVGYAVGWFAGPAH